MASELDLVTVERAAARLKVTESDEELPSLITTVSELLRDWVGYPLHKRTAVVETCAGGAQHLFLPSGAVRSVASIIVRGVERASSTWKVEDARKGIIRALGEPWPFTGRSGDGVSQAPMFREDTGEIVVTFDAGWVTPGQVEIAEEADPGSTLTSDLPAVFQEAALVALTSLYLGAGQNPNIQAMSLGSGSISFRDSSQAELPVQSRALVKSYRKLGRGTS